MFADILTQRCGVLKDPCETSGSGVVASRDTEDPDSPKLGAIEVPRTKIGYVMDRASNVVSRKVYLQADEPSFAIVDIDVSPRDRPPSVSLQRCAWRTP